MKLVQYLLFLCLFACPSLLAQGLLVGQNALVDGAGYFVSDEALDFDVVRQTTFRPFQPSDINQGVNGRHHWLHFTVSNPGDETLDWVLRGETSYLDHLVIYARDGSGDFVQNHFSDRQPFHTRQLDYRTLSYAHSTPPGGSTEIYLQAWHDKADSLSLRFDLVTQADFDKRQKREHLIFGLFYGAVGTLIIMASIFALLLRQPSALNYALFLTFTALLWLMLNGLGYQYLWPNAVYWHNEGFHLVFLAFCFFALRFSSEFLQLRRLAPRMAQLFRVLQGIIIATALLRLAGVYRAVLEICYLLLFSLALLIPVASAISWRSGLHYGLWSLMAWLVYALGIVSSLVSAYTHLLPWGMFPLIFLQVGSLLETLFLMAGMAKWLVWLERERQRALTLAHEDPLTGLGNRRRLQEAFRHFREHPRHLYLIVIDLDFFKDINDSYGHDAGDEVLRDVGRMLRQFCRKDDIAVRYGGEEFAILMEAGSVNEAMNLAERLRRQFAGNPTRYEGREIPHTLSCGLVEIDPGTDQRHVREMMRRADAALYEAKNRGRNQCYIYRPDMNADPTPSSTEVP